MAHARDTEGLDNSIARRILEDVVWEAVDRVAYSRFSLGAVNIGPLQHLLAGINGAHRWITAPVPDRNLGERSGVARGLTHEIAELGSCKPFHSRGAGGADGQRKKLAYAWR